jgi:hypothetical protein
MKKHAIFSEPLLLTQLEIAMLLGVNRTQWALYSSGQRGLPARTRLKFEKLLLETNKGLLARRQQSAKIIAQEGEIKKELETLLQDNTLKQLQIQRKLSRMEARFEAALNTLQFVQHYPSDEKSKTLIQVLEIKANRVLDKNKLALQEVYKIKLEVLKHEKKLLEIKLHKQ